ncbi:MAG: hypothetical protein JO243_12840 [Solirubrobacterales bacterium]|nr:hypothetical protein [Solirubrobacterales bacterium]
MPVTVLIVDDHVVLTSGRDRRYLEPLIRASAARWFIAMEKLSPAALGEFLR